MTCCGPLREITTQDDKIPQFFCEECGKIGPPSAFPDPAEPREQPSRLGRIRRWITWIENKL